MGCGCWGVRELGGRRVEGEVVFARCGLRRFGLGWEVRSWVAVVRSWRLRMMLLSLLRYRETEGGSLFEGLWRSPLLD